MFELTEPKELTLQSKWIHNSEEVGESNSAASVFGAQGVMAIPPHIKSVDIPKMNALSVPKSFLKKYGAELVPLDQPVLLDKINDKDASNLYLVEYHWDKDYVEKYIMNNKGGGGIFVETHPFPHVFVPLSKDSQGALILGVARDDGLFDFAAFEIPFGFMIKIDNNVIHGDSFFIGPYAIALTDAVLADAVLFKQDVPERTLQSVTQKAVKPAHLPLQAEFELATQVNHMLISEQIRAENTHSPKSLSFFQQLPPDVLTEVNSISAEAQEAFDQKFGIVVAK